MSCPIIPESCFACALLFDRQPDNHALIATAKGQSRNRRRLGIVRASRDPDIAGIRADTVGDIEPDPAQPVNMRFGPGVACLLLDAVGEHQIATDIARRMPQHAGCSDEDMGMVLTHAVPQSQRSVSRGFSIGMADIIAHGLADMLGQCVQGGQRVIALLLAGPGERRISSPGSVKRVGFRKYHKGT